MAGWSRRQQALVAALVVAVALLAALTVMVWPDDDSSVAVGDDVTASTTTSPETTTTTTVPSTTSEPTTTIEEPVTSTAPPTTRPTTTAAPSPPTVPDTTTTTLPPPPYRSSIESVTAAQLGSSYTAGMGCTEPSALRAVNVTHWGYDGAVHDGRLIVAADEADNVAAIFGDLYTARFPIERIEPIDAYDSDDQASMRANNSSGYNCRYVAGTEKLSNHAFGKAIDINPLHNPYVKGDKVDPPEGAPWADRSNQRTGMIYGGDAVVQAFEARGWSWGGYWSSPDYQHFDK